MFGLGILALLAGGLLAALWYRGPGDPAASPAAKMASVSVLKASHPLPAGMVLRPADVAWTLVPEADVAAADIRRTPATETALIGAVTRRAFQAGESLSLLALVKSGDPEFLAAALRPGYRAVSIEVDATQSTSGLLLPGDDVDIVLTQNFSTQGTDQGHKALGETVLHGLRVIAIDQTVAAAGEQPAGTPAAAPHLPKNVTLEVTQRQATMLLVAQQLGKLALTLRGDLDPDSAPPVVWTPPSPTWASDVSPALRPPPAAPTAPPPQSDPTTGPRTGQRGTIDVIRGEKVERLCLTSGNLVPCQ